MHFVLIVILYVIVLNCLYMFIACTSYIALYCAMAKNHIVLKLHDIVD